MFLAPCLYHIICAVFFVFRSVRSLYGSTWLYISRERHCFVEVKNTDERVCVCVVCAVSKCIFSGVHGWAGGGVYTCSDSCFFLLL